MSIKIPFGTEGLPQATKEIQDFSKQSRIALTSLSLVAQDLPFGFIGIQNNLPGVIQSFSALRAETGSVGGALKSLATGLVGPAGIFLAFSAVTSIITFAIQKYGSLSNAINVLTSSNSLATATQLKFNKELNEGIANTSAESAKITILVRTLSDLNKPLKDRQSAYAELKKIQPDIIQGISEENALTATGTSLIQNNAKARIEYIKLKVQENAISKILNENGLKQLELETKVLSNAEQLAATREKISKLSEKALSESQQRTLSILIEKEKIQADALKSVTIEYNKLNSVNDIYLNKLEKTLSGVSLYDKKTQDLTQSLKDQAKAAKDAERASIGKITEGIGGIGKIIDNDKYIAKTFAANRRIQVNSLKEITKENSIYTREYLKNQNAIQNALTLEDFGDKSKRKFKSQKIEPIGKGILFNTDIYKQFNALDALVTKFQETKNALNAVFFEPLSDLFQNFFETGKLSLKSFGDAILKEIQRIVTKIIVSGIIQLLANLLVPGGGTAAAGTTGAKGFGKILKDVFQSVPGTPQIANPSFSGIGGAPLAMNGQVNLILRGSDLVGSLNRTNSTINRVG